MSEFTETYRNLTDSELLNVWAERSQLIGSAKANLVKEIQRRSLREEAEIIAQTTPEDRPEDNSPANGIDSATRSKTPPSTLRLLVFWSFMGGLICSLVGSIWFYRIDSPSHSALWEVLPRSIRDALTFSFIIGGYFWFALAWEGHEAAGAIVCFLINGFIYALPILALSTVVRILSVGRGRSISIGLLVSLMLVPSVIAMIFFIFVLQTSLVPR